MAATATQTATDAAAPPANAPTLCGVRGMVHSVMQEEMQAVAGGNRVMVPVVVMEVAETKPVDANYKGAFCKGVSTPQMEGGKAMGYYRLCDATAEFMTGQTIAGVVGLSKGGGRYCIAQIQVIP